MLGVEGAGPGRLLVVESCRRLCLVTRFVHVVARRPVVVGVCGTTMAVRMTRLVARGSVRTLRQG